MKQRIPRTNLRQLERKIRHNAVYTPITYFYHVTDGPSKSGIIHTRKLYGTVAEMTQPPSIQSPIHGRLRGVFFSCNLSRKGYGLPPISPLGSERIRIPITEFASSKLHLFYNSNHRNSRSNMHYVTLVLVKESDPKYKFCKAHMTELNMASNLFLRLDFWRGKFKYCEPTKFSMWVEIFVVGDVSLIGTRHTWDKVTDISQNYDDDSDDDSDDDDFDDDSDDNSDDDDDFDDDSNDDDEFNGTSSDSSSSGSNVHDDYSDYDDDDTDSDDEPRYNGYHGYYNNY